MTGPGTCMGRAISLRRFLFALVFPAVALGATPEPPKLRLPEGAKPTSYAVELTLLPAESAFAGMVDAEIDLSKATSLLWLNGSDLTVDKATITSSGKEHVARVVPGGDDFLGLEVDGPVGPGQARLHIAYRGKVYDKDIGGVFHQKEDGQWYLYSHFEALDARRAFPCFDEPGFKVPWQLTLNVPADLFAASNTSVEAETSGAGGLRKVRFKKTQPLPSYLVAFTVGPFDVLDAGKAGRKRTPVRILAFKGRGSEARYAADSTGPILALLEDYFDMPYPYEKLDEVAVPQFLGAMENAGMITFASRLILSKPSELSARRQRSYGNVCAHELAHQWFGDLVTMAWWDDVWLNESFASWMASKIVDRWKPSWGGAVGRVSSRLGAIQDDSLLSARAIRQPIESNDDVANAFDGITYSKGEAVLEMFESYLGPDRFRDGVRAYLKKNAWGNATAKDFLASVSAAAGKDVAPAFGTFLDKPGVPIVTAKLVCDKEGGNRLRLSQERYLPVGAKVEGDAKSALWQCPVCVAYGDGVKRGRTCVLLDKPTLDVPLDDLGGCPQWVLPNDGEAGYYLVDYDAAFTRWAFGKASQSLSIPERVGMMGNLEALVGSGRFSAGEALALLPDQVQGGDRHVLGRAAGIASSVRDHLVPPELRPNYSRYIRRLFGERARALGLTPKPDEDDETRLLRPTVVSLVGEDGEDPEIISQAKALARQYLDDRKAVDPEMAGVVLGIAARNGDRALFDRILEEAKKATDRQERARLLSAMGSFRDPEITKAAYEVVLGDQFEARQSIAILWQSLDDPDRAEAAFTFVQKHFDELVARLPRDYGARLSGVGDAFCDEPHAAAVDAFFRDRSGKYAGGPRDLAQTLESIRLCAAQRSAQEVSVAQFLKTQ